MKRNWSVLGHITLAAVLAGLAGLGVVFTPAAALVAALIVLPALAAGIGSSVVLAHVDHPTPQQTLRGVRVGAAAAAATAVAVAALAGLVAVAGDATPPLLLLAGFPAAAVLWPRLRPRLDRWRATRSGTEPVPCTAEPDLAVGPRPLVRVLDSLSTPALCREWQRSFAVVTDATDPVALVEVADLRRRYLDELERRDPDALARWLAGDTRASTSPYPHLSTPAVQTPAGPGNADRAPAESADAADDEHDQEQPGDGRAA